MVVGALLVKVTPASALSVTVITTEAVLPPHAAVRVKLPVWAPALTVTVPFSVLTPVGRVPVVLQLTDSCIAMPIWSRRAAV